jgi:hypothetical protein
MARIVPTACCARAASRVLGLLLALPGCAAVGDWVHDRGADAADVLRGHVMIGFGVDLMVEVTRALRLGAGYYEAECAGLHNRALGTWSERIEEGGVAFLHGRFEHVSGIPRVSGSYGTVPPWGAPRLLQPDETWVDLFVVRATAFAGLGIDLELRLGQLLDLLGGLFLWDPAHDDDLPPEAVDEVAAR